VAVVGVDQVTAKGNVLNVLLVDATTGELFATCPVTEPGSKAVDPVVDSSRYFVLRIDDGKGRHAFIGMGFRDRNFSYDFNATLQDHWKGVERQKEADEMRKEMEARAASEPMRDLSLKDGEKLSIKVNVPGRKTDGSARKYASDGGGGSGFLPPPPGGGLLAPPPKAGETPRVLAAPATAPAAVATADDDFGDFSDFKDAGGDGGDDDFGYFSGA